MLNINGEKNIFISFWFYYDITAIALEAKIYQEILSSGQAEDVFSFFFFFISFFLLYEKFSTSSVYSGRFKSKVAGQHNRVSASHS